MKRWHWLLPLLLLAAACAEHPESPSSSGPTFAAQAPQSEYVSTPMGWYHRSCVYQIPGDAVVDRGGKVTRKDGSTYQLAKCMFPARMGGLRPEPRGVEVPAPTDSGWMEDARATDQPRYHWFTQLVARWTVPPAPSGQYSGGQVYYTFPGLMSDRFIIQPVLTYHHDGNYWQIAAWQCDSLVCPHSDLLTTYPGHVIIGSVTAMNCGDHLCDWLISVVDSNAQQWTHLTINDTEDYWRATGGAVEVYGLNSCNQYPANGVFYRNIALLDQDGYQVSPGFRPVYGTPMPDPWCDFNVTYTDTTVNLYHNIYVAPPLDASILGPSQVQAGQYCTWWASVSGGQSPYSYQWSGKLSGTGSQVTGRLYSSGWLDLTVTDAAQHADHASLYITVGGGALPVGPQTLCPM